MDRTRRSALAITTASLVCLFTALSGPASASGSKGIRGEPQPELKPFKISAATSPGSVAMEPNGSLVVAYDIKSGTSGKTFVCLLDRGARKCSHAATLSPLGGDHTFDVPEVFVPSANHVVVLQETCCDTNPAGGDLLFSSSDGGKTFGAAKRVGSLAVKAAALIGGNIVFSAGGSGGARVESIPVTASGPPVSTATAISKESFDTGVGSYHSGALIASDYLGSDYTTYVAYAPSGRNFDVSGSYHKVGSFSHEHLIAMSGAALLTVQTTGKQALVLRLFNGSGFGSKHIVPGTSGGGPEWYTVAQDPSGRVHVFTERSRTGYDLIEVSTSNGTRWGKSLNLGNAISSTSFSAALDSHGSGLVLGTEPAWGYPVLASQGISFSLKSSTIGRGHSTTGSGKGSPAAKGRRVELQVERSGLWYTVATTHEGSGGSFSFTIKGSSLGTHKYRAVVSYLAGYLLYGYSSARSLRVT